MDTSATITDEVNEKDISCDLHAATFMLRLLCCVSYAAISG